MTVESLGESKSELRIGADKLSGLAHFLNTHNQADEAIIFINGTRCVSKVLSSLEQIGPLLELLKNGFTEEGPNIPYLTRELSKLPVLEETLSSYTPNELGPKPWPDNPYYICDRGGENLKKIEENMVEEILREARTCHVYHTGYQQEKENFSVIDKFRNIAWDALFNLDENFSSWLDTLQYCEQHYHESFKHDIPQFEYESQVHHGHLSYGAGHIIYYLQCLSNGTKIETSKRDKWPEQEFKALVEEITKRYLDEYNIEVTPQDLIDIALKKSGINKF
jgi:hypothetical protein